MISCCSNAAFTFHLASLSYEVRALRDIVAGEEITISYVEKLSSAAERQKELTWYDFICKCPACLDPVTSDRIRVPLWDAPLPKKDGSVSLKAAKQMVSLLERACLQDTTHYPVFLKCLSLAYRNANKTDKMVVYEEKATRAMIAAMGRDCELQHQILACPDHLEPLVDIPAIPTMLQWSSSLRELRSLAVQNPAVYRKKFEDATLLDTKNMAETLCRMAPDDAGLRNTLEGLKAKLISRNLI